MKHASQRSMLVSALAADGRVVNFDNLHMICLRQVPRSGRHAQGWTHLVAWPRPAAGALRRAKSTESTRRVVVERWFIGSLSRGVMVLMGLTVGLAGSWLLLGLNKLAYRYSPAWSVSSLQPTAGLRPATHSGDSPGRLDLPGGASPSPWTGAVDPCPGPGTFCPGTQARGGQSWCRDRGTRPR